LERVEQVLQRLLNHGVHVKCWFFQCSVNFLGHCIDAEDLQMTEDKLQAIIREPAPKNIQELFW